MKQKNDNGNTFQAIGIIKAEDVSVIFSLGGVRSESYIFILLIDFFGCVFNR